MKSLTSCYYTRFLVFILFFSFSIDTSFAYETLESQNAKTVSKRLLLKMTESGRLFLGGKPPKFERLDVIDEIKKNGKYYYLLKATVLRSSGDTNGNMVLFKAKNYGEAMVWLIGLDRGIKKVFDTLFPVSLDKRPFPPVLMTYKYVIYANEVGGNIKISNGKSRKSKGKNRFIENLSMGFQPGTYDVKLDVKVDSGDHEIYTLFKLFDIPGWFDLVFDIEGEIANQVKGWSDLFTPRGLGKAIAKQAIKNKLLSTSITTRLIVKAKVPYLKGKKPSEAVKELRARRLGFTSQDRTNCPSKFYNKVYRQKPQANDWLKKNEKVTLVVCRDKKKGGKKKKEVGKGGGGKLARYIDNGDGTIKDKETSLVWQKESGILAGGQRDAISYCKGLTLANSRWELPTIDQLKSLVDETKGSPTIDTTYFPNTNSSPYWSSTTTGSYVLSYYWYVNFYDGSASSIDPSGDNYVRCVRGG